MGGDVFTRATSSPGGLASSGSLASNIGQLRMGARERGASASMGGFPSPLPDQQALRGRDGVSSAAAASAGTPSQNLEGGAVSPSAEDAWGRSYAAELSRRAQQGDMAAVEELASAVRFGLLGLPVQPEVARGLMTIAAQSGGVDGSWDLKASVIQILALILTGALLCDLIRIRCSLPCTRRNVRGRGGRRQGLGRGDGVGPAGHAPHRRWARGSLMGSSSLPGLRRNQGLFRLPLWSDALGQPIRAMDEW